MKKKIVCLAIVLMFLFALPLSVSSAFADNDNVYTYEDSSASVVYTLIDETKYESVAVSKSTNDTICVSGTYVIEENVITFYLSGEILFSGEIAENNVLIEVKEPIEEIKESIEKIKEIDITTIIEWVLAGVVGLFGTTAVAILFRKQLKALLNQVISALASLNKNKDNAKEEIKEIVQEAKETIKALKKVRDSVSKEKEEVVASVESLKKMILCMANGTKELVVNGTSETLCGLVEKEVNENASKEV